MSTPLHDILSDAIALIERGWTQRAPARRADGVPCGPRDDDAAAWCITAAIYHSSTIDDFAAHYQAERLVRTALGWSDTQPNDDPKKRKSLTIWNDAPERTAADVLAVLCLARLPVRKLLVPHDYRVTPVLGWLKPEGFVPDEPTTSLDCDLFDVETTNDTPTVSPPRPPEGTS